MEFIVREISSKNWITILIMASLLLLVIAQKINETKYGDFKRLFSSNKYIVSHQKQHRFSSTFNIVLFFFQAIIISIFIFLSIKVFKWDFNSDDTIFYYKILVLYTIFVLCKVLIEKIIATIFALDYVIDEYLFYKVSYRSFIAIILLPINILFIYSVEPTQIIFSILFGILIIINVYMLLFYYKKNENVILNNFFYFILYLCALEIAPYYILYKLIS